MTRFLKKITAAAVTVTVVLSLFAISVSAFDYRERMDCFKNYGSPIVCVAHRGDWHSYPENSAEAVKTAAEYGVVSVDVKITSDGKAVLMADDTLDRMCVDGSGKTVSGNVNSYTLAEIKEMFLRNANGTVKNSKTDFHPASLTEAVETAKGEAILMLTLKCADFKAVYEEVKSLNALEGVVFRFTDKNKTILNTVSGIKDITICGNYQGNIIFMATSVVKNCREQGVCTVELGSKNGHGVLYDNFHMKRFNADNRAMVSMVNGRCGKRTDNEMGWDDLISRGYSIIETDYPSELCAYIQRIDAERDQLERYISLYENTDIAPYTTDTESVFVSAVNDGKALLQSPASLSELENARFNLQSAFDNLTVGQKKAVTLAFQFSWGRFAAALLCGAAILISQILLYKRREKKGETK